MAKQSPKTNRRVLVGTAYQPQLSVFVINTFDAMAGVLQLVQSEGKPGIPVLPIFKVGEGSEFYAVAAEGGEVFPSVDSEGTIDGTELNIEFGALDDGDYYLVIPPYLPGYRSRWGGYLAPALTLFTVAN